MTEWVERTSTLPELTPDAVVKFSRLPLPVTRNFDPRQIVGAVTGYDRATQTVHMRLDSGLASEKDAGYVDFSVGYRIKGSEAGIWEVATVPAQGPASKAPIA